MMIGPRAALTLSCALAVVLVAWSSQAAGSAVASALPATPGSAAPAGQAAAPDGQAGGPGSTQTSDGGRVTVAVTWNGPASGGEFDVRLDTHSVDLDGVTLADASLRNDRGDQLTGPAWDAPKGGHHRGGTLRFSAGAAFFSGSRSIELTLLGVGEVPTRTFRWTTGS